MITEIMMGITKKDYLCKWKNNYNKKTTVLIKINNISTITW